MGRCILALFAALPVLGLAQNPCIPYPVGSSTYLVCVPPGAPPSIDLVVFAHGYVSPLEPAGQIPIDQLSLQGVPIPGLVNSLGFAFATSSYPKNGLAIKEGMADLENLVAFYKGLGYSPGKVYLVGVSEGGLVTAKLIEAGGPAFSGGLAMCGPVGDFRAQINHFDDFRVIFDYFFPGVLDFPVVSIPGSAMAAWDTQLAPGIAAAIAANPAAARQLYRVTLTPSDPQQPAASALAVLWYNVFATDDANAELGGQPYSNRFRFYVGAQNDFLLNQKVERFSADPAALAEIQQFYQTSGKLPAPLVTMHTTGDPVVPYWQETLYGFKVLFNGSTAEYTNLPVIRYGHCNFQPAEVLLGFSLLVQKVSGQALANPEAALPSEEMRRQYRALLQKNAGRSSPDPR